MAEYSKHDIERFLEPQGEYFQTALKEIEAERKESHWMWFIFPQLRSLGHSHMAYYYGLDDLQEAQRFYAHPVLRRNLIQISQALLATKSHDIEAILGYPDNLKLCSCMTLFDYFTMTKDTFAERRNRLWQQVLLNAKLNLLAQKRLSVWQNSCPMKFLQSLSPVIHLPARIRNEVKRY